MIKGSATGEGKEKEEGGGGLPGLGGGDSVSEVR